MNTPVPVPRDGWSWLGRSTFTATPVGVGGGTAFAVDVWRCARCYTLTDLPDSHDVWHRDVDAEMAAVVEGSAHG